MSQLNPSLPPLPPGLHEAAFRLVALLETCPVGTAAHDEGQAEAAQIWMQAGELAHQVQSMALAGGLREPLVRPGIFIGNNLPSRAHDFCRFVGELHLPRRDWFPIPGEAFGDIRVLSIGDDLRRLVHCPAAQRLPAAAVQQLTHDPRFAPLVQRSFSGGTSDEDVQRLAWLIGHHELVNVAGFQAALRPIATTFAMLEAAMLMTEDPMTHWKFDQTLARAWDLANCRA